MPAFLFPLARSGSALAGDRRPINQDGSALLPLVTEPIQYHHGQGGGLANGVNATTLPQICDVWLKARDAGVLTEPQKAIAQKAEILIRGLAHIGILALVEVN